MKGRSPFGLHGKNTTLNKVDAGLCAFANKPPGKRTRDSHPSMHMPTKDMSTGERNSFAYVRQHTE
jgi:hypothetical protein